MATPPDFEVSGNNAKALFSLKVFRGEGMALLGMNWLNGTPPDNFVGFAIEYQEPGGTQFYTLNNRLSFLDNNGNVNPNILSTRLSPIQKFRWIHFPYNANLPGNFTYRVTPVFMNTAKVLSYGDYQEAAIQLQSETYPGELNVAFTRGFVASQAFIEKFAPTGDISTLLPANVNQGLTFVPTNPKETEALAWMGFEARAAIIDVLDKAIADTSANVKATAYDLNEPGIVSRLVKLGTRLTIIIDNSDGHGKPNSAEDQAEKMLIASAGATQVQRQKMGGLQHNKTITVDGANIKSVVCGSTNLSWRGFFVQNNNAIVLHGAQPVAVFSAAFKNLWDNPNSASGFAKTPSSNWNDLGLPGVKAKVAFSPHSAANAVLQSIADDIAQTTSSLLYSLAFLYETKPGGPILEAIEKVTADNSMFVYGMSDKSVGGLDIQRPDGNPPVVFPASLLKNVPEPFKAEVTGGSGPRMHHKFVVIDFDKPTARVYMGSYNFSNAADRDNGENLLLIDDRRIAVSYMVEAVAMFDHYEFRDAKQKAGTPGNKIHLHLPPQSAAEKPWWSEDYTDKQKIRDRELFS
jgi:hypothetical protein